MAKTPAPARDKPLLTAISERILLRVLRPRSSDADPAPLLAPPRRLLAVKAHGMGDSVMVRSLLDHLRRRHPGVDIGVLAGSANRDVFTTGSSFHIHHYDQKSLGPGAILRQLIAIRRRRYEAVIDFEQGSLAGSAFLRAAGIPVRVGFILLNSSTKAAFLTHALRFRETDSMWTSFIRLMRVIDRDFPETISTTPLPLDDESRRSARGWLRSATAGPIDHVVALHLGCNQGRPYRQWPLEKFIALANRLSLESPNTLIALTGQPFERPRIEQFIAGYNGTAVDATPLGSIAKVAALLSDCALVVSNDTGVMHLGAAMGAPTVGIFGPATPRQWAPVGPFATAVAPVGVSCSPCADTYKGCDPPDCVNPDRMRCLREVSVEMVLEAANTVMSARIWRNSGETMRAVH